MVAVSTNQKITEVDTLHGVTVAGPYRWLENDSIDGLTNKLSFMRYHLGVSVKPDKGARD